jgi:TolB-like protein
MAGEDIYSGRIMKTNNIIASLLITILFISCSANKKSSRVRPAQPGNKTTTDQKERIAVLDFKTINLPAEKSRIVSELIRTDLINTNKFIVIERSQVDMIFKEHGFASTGFTDESSAVKIGKILAAQKILIGTVMKVGDSIVVTCRVVDVEKGIADASAKVTADSEESLVSETGTLVASLTGEAVSVQSKAITPKVILKLTKQIYAKGEDIVVTYKKFPGTKYDYISIAKEYESARNHYTYQYTGGQTEGSVIFYSGVAEPGKYEARSHTNYHKGNIQPTAVLKFTVK